MRLAEFQKVFSTLGIDACLLTCKDPNFFYFVQQEFHDAALLIPARGKPYLLLTPLESANTGAFRTATYDAALKSILNKQHALGLNYNELSTTAYRKIRKLVRKTKDVHSYLERLRSIKTAEEIAIIRKACRITCQLMNDLFLELKKRKFSSEADIKIWIKTKILLQGYKPSFEPVVASGKDGAIPHYSKNKKLARGFLVLDFGIKYRGYCSDMTRTVFLGKPAQHEKEMYELVKNCQEGVIDFAAVQFRVEKQNTASLHKKACELLGRHSKYFIHSLGHGIGIKVHEQPNISPRSQSVLTRGMVFTVEPGYYKGFGIRIEDDIFLGNYLENLTRFSPKNLLVFPL